MGLMATRRWFIGGLASFGAFGGARVLRAAEGAFAGRKPLLSFGVVSDVHVGIAPDGKGLDKGHDTATLDKAFAWFRDQGVDAVMIAGDIADKGCVAELEAVAGAWFRAFPGDAAPDGRHVERLFVYGNHDWEGFRYDGAAKQIFGDDLDAHTIRSDLAAAWKKAFGEEYSPVWRKEVKGYTFVGAHWTADWCRGSEEAGVPQAPEWFKANGIGFFAGSGTTQSSPSLSPLTKSRRSNTMRSSYTLASRP